MDSYNDRSQPYSIRVPLAQSAGELHVGWRSYQINVVDISWQTITIALPQKIAARIRHHSKAIVWNQGNQWRVVVEGRPQKQEKGIATLALSLADQDDPRLKRILKSSGQGTTQMGTQRIGSDPLVMAVIIVGLMIAFLISPGWGERWGTSGTLTEGITELISGISGFFTQLF